MNVQLRELSPADCAQLVSLTQRSLSDPVDDRLIRRLLAAEPDARPELHLAAWRNGELLGAALGSVRRHDELLVGGPRLLVVDPALQRQGLGAYLLNELEQRLQAIGVHELRVGNLAPNYLWPGVPETNRAMQALLAKQGYELAGETLNMTVDLNGRDWLAGINPRQWSIRRARYGEIELAAWAGERWGAAWQWEAAQAVATDPPTALVAERDGEYGGFACWDVSGLWGTFGPTGVDEALQGHGLGRALLCAALAAMASAGYRQIEIGWVGPQEFYTRVANAQPGRICLLYRKPVLG
ncbi:MAG: GNAT family N-acetyltransferase [Chloroflexus sp.]|nr:GNAT family N-acetyltransferase [Chloroflexus sp.]